MSQLDVDSPLIPTSTGNISLGSVSNRFSALHVESISSPTITYLEMRIAQLEQQLDKLRNDVETGVYEHAH